MEFQKIDTLFMRDANNIIIPTEYTKPEFEYLANCKWECTEKIDGTNIRIEMHKCHNGLCMSFEGRHNNSNIPTNLLLKLNQLFTRDKLMEVFNLTEESPIDLTLIGEGFGAGIQKGGNYISKGVDFSLFAIKVDRWWLNRSLIEKLADKLGVAVVPLIGYMTIPEAVEFVKKGFKSTIAENKDYNAEGLVLTTPDGLLFRNGERIMTKIKTIDFIKYHNKYGDKVVKQSPNPKYNQ